MSFRSENKFYNALKSKRCSISITHNVYNKMFPVPEGFREILYDFGMEILRSNPKDILEYGHEYFKAKDEGLPLNFNRPASEDQNVPKEDPKKSLPKEEPKSSSHEKEENKETPKGDGSGSPKDTAKLNKDKAHKQEIIKTPESKVSSAAEDVKKEAEKYVSDMIEKVSQDEEDEAGENVSKANENPTSPPKDSPPAKDP